MGVWESAASQPAVCWPAAVGLVQFGPCGYLVSSPGRGRRFPGPAILSWGRLRSVGRENCSPVTPEGDPTYKLLGPTQWDFMPAEWLLQQQYAANGAGLT